MTVNRTALLVFLLLCPILPAAAQAPCSSFGLTLEVDVGSAGSSEADALANLDREMAAVLEAVGTPCVTNTGEPATEPYTDGTWYAVQNIRVAGNEDDLRALAGSLGGAATPVQLWGLFPVALVVAVASYVGVTPGMTMWFRRDEKLDVSLVGGNIVGAVAAVVAYLTVTAMLAIP